MDRQFVYPGQIPLETDLLNTNRNVMVALGALIGDLFGTNTVFSGLSAVPTIPASMSVTVNPGHVYSLQNIDNTAYSSLAANEAQQIMKQGLLATAQTLAMTAPVTAGQSVNYLISAAFVEQDIGPTVLPYYNAANPQVAWSGPGGLGGVNNTTRQDTVALTLTPGVPATTGTQTTPATPTGTTPLYVVTVANGATTIIAANIVSVSGAPVLPNGVLQSLITSNLTYGIDNGSVNTIQATFPIPVTTLIDGMDVWVKIKLANTGATTFTPNLGAIAAAPVVGAAHNALQGGETVAGGRANLVYRADITSWVMVECTGGADQIAPATESQHAVQLGQLTAVGINPGRLLRTTVIYNNAGVLTSSVNGGAFAPYGATTFSTLAATQNVDIECQGAGAGSGGCSATSSTQYGATSGGQGGAYCRGWFTAAQVNGALITCGAAGVGGVAGGNGTNGGTSSVGSLLTAPGGGASPGAGTAPTSSNFIGALNLIAVVMATGGYLNIGSSQGGQPVGIAGSSTRVFGGSSPLGAGGFSNGTTGGNGTGFGAGAAGVSVGTSTAASSGGNGAPGAHIYREYA